MKESDLLAHIAARSAGLSAAFGQVVVGPGDDCAVVRTPGGEEILLTTDHLVEGRHYEVGTPIDLIARKAVARSVSDIAAMGGTPAWSLATACLPRGYRQADEMFAAMKRWAEHWGCPLVGGDIASFGEEGAPLVLTVTVGGMMAGGLPPDSDGDTREAAAWSNSHNEPRRPVLRSGARPGDVVSVTGVIGGALESGHHLRFDPRVAEARRAHLLLGPSLHAMIDLSDGLGRDAGRLARASGVVVEIDGSRLPLREGVAAWQDGVRGGEDYELLMSTAPVDFEFCPSATCIGSVRALNPGESSGVWVTDPYGQRHEVSGWGWDHE